MMKVTATACSNLAFVKYWGRDDEALKIPSNGSISMTLDGLKTKTTVEFSDSFEEDFVMIDKKKDINAEKRVLKFIDVIRKKTGIKKNVKVVSENSFPSSTGLSSSASGFAALAASASKAAGMNLDKKELSILARKGSGSACRSVYGGFVEWIKGNDDSSSYSVQLHELQHWDILDIVAVVSSEKKQIPTSEGQRYARTSPFFDTRSKYIKDRLRDCKKAISEKDFSMLGKLAEQEAIDLHCIMLSSYPHLIYWSEGSLRLIKEIPKWRHEGIEAYFSLNTGQDVHVLCLPDKKDIIIEKLNKLDYVKDIIINKPGPSPKFSEDHLF